MDWRILVNFIRQSMLKLPTHSGFHDLFLNQCTTAFNVFCFAFMTLPQLVYCFQAFFVFMILQQEYIVFNAVFVSMTLQQSSIVFDALFCFHDITTIVYCFPYIFCCFHDITTLVYCFQRFSSHDIAKLVYCFQRFCLFS